MVVTNLNENYETEETMFGVIFSTNLTALRYISITQILFWISSATCKYTYWMVQKQKTKGLANWVREWEKMKGHGAVWNISLVFFFFLRIKVFFILIYWILTTIYVKKKTLITQKK